jgi:hypothetical protein
LFFNFYREEHIEKKIQMMVKEAKEKLGKGDKKGAFSPVSFLVLSVFAGF